MKNFKRTLAMMLVLCMVFGMLPVGVSAAVELGTTGTVVGEPFDDSASLSDNSPDHTNYRIPGLVMLNDGTLVAAADIRYDYEYDGGGSDIVVSTSTDKGENWNYSVVAYLGDNGNIHATNSSTMMDPLLITDGENLYLLYDLFPAGYSLGGGSNTTYAFSATGTGFNSNGKMVLSTSYNSTSGGYYLDGDKIYADNGNVQSNYTVDEWFNVYQNGTYVSNLFFADSPFYAYPTSYIAMQTSSDGGANWSDPELVNIKHDGIKWQVLGPGSGIVTQSGELAFTVYNSDSSISLVTGSSGDWTTVRTYAATNESSIVELSDGTIRAFVKNDSNVITYVDFALNEDGTYKAGSAVSTGVSNTGWCMISSTMYSRGINEDDVILVCCPASSGLRRYGTVYAFTVDPETNAMSKAGSWQIDTGYDDQFFAYSDMQELEDGRIAMLYEDGCLTYSSAPWSGSAAGIGYSHIKYITFDPAEKLGLTFDVDPDIFVWTADNADGEIRVDSTAGVTHIHAVPTTVDSITGAYSAYDIHLCTEGDDTCTDCSSCDKAYTGSATVTLPLTGELQSASRVKAFVVESDGSVTSIYNVENDGEFVTFEAPHFSVVGIAEVAEDEVTYEEKVAVTLHVGESKTFPIEGYSYTEDDVKLAPVASIATLDKLEAKAEAADSEVGDAVTAVTEGTYVIYTYLGAYVTNEAEGNYIALSPTEQTVWSVAVADSDAGTYYITDSDGNYLYVNSGTAGVTADQTAVKLVYGTSTDGPAQSGFFIQDANGSYNLNNSGGTSNAYGKSGANGSWSRWQLKPVNETYTYSTDVTFTGVSAGETTAVIGHVAYEITVEEDIRDIVISQGFSKTDTIYNANYSTADVTQQPDSTIATLDSVNGFMASDEKTLVEVSALESGKQYLLVNNRAGKTLTASTNDVGLLLDGTASVDSSHLWTVEGSGDYYTVRYGTDGGYLNVGYGTAGVTDSAVTLQLDYIEDSGHWLINDRQGYYGLNDFRGEHTIAAGWSDASTDEGSWWTIYEIVAPNATARTEVTFTGVTPGKTTAVIGHVTYNITVKAVSSGDISDFTNIVGVDQYSDDNSNASYRSDLDMAGKKITSLRISEGASFHLGVDVTGYDEVIWSVADEAIATVDENGNVTAVAEGETAVTATVIKDGVSEAISIPVTVVPSMVENYSDDEITTIFYYIEDIDYTDPYYTMFLSTENEEGPVAGHELVQVTEGEVIWYERPTNSAFAWVWTADPWEGYALTYMASTGSVSQYYPLKNAETGELGESDYDTTTAQDPGEYYKYSISYKNIESVGTDVSSTIGANWRSAVDELLADAILVGKDIWPNYGCDGAMSNTRWDHDGVPKLVTSMTFVSDPMPRIEKSVQGILPTTRLRKDFRTYTDGMVATVNEYVYFNVRITLDRPTIWTDEANGIGAITYTDAIVSDTVLPAAYFYVQANDTNMDGVITGDEVTTGQTVNITDQLNAAWGADEQTRTIDLYLIYEITEDDIPKFTITNTADLKWNYQSHYSTGKLSGSADAEASITVVGSSIDDVVIDFGQTIVYEGLTEAQLKGVYVDTLDGDPVEGGSKVDTKYGTVTIAKHTVEDTDGNEAKTAYTYTVTYTPHTILQAPDAVLMYGLGEENKEKIINGFVVYPATTVYYEEGFLLDGVTDWDTTNAKSATKEQKLELLNESVYDANGLLTGFQSDKTYAYGYDPIYAAGSVAESEISTNVTGAKTSFTFTGTGFELFANSKPETGWILVEVVRANGTNAKMYMVNTAATPGDTGATSGQTIDLDSLPIVSIKNLEHGTYTVNLRKLRDDDKTIIIDGVRITNTVADSSVFNIDLEDNPEFYQLRDMVLNAVGIQADTSEDYGDVTGKAQQVYNGLTNTDSELPVALITDPNKLYDDYTAQDLLDNGPKNELYLWAGQTLTFKVTTARALQIGLKAPAGATSYTLTYKVGDDTTAVATDAALTSTEDLFYALGNPIGQLEGSDPVYTITVKNTGSSILSVTDLKICDDPTAAFVPLEEADIRSILLNAGYVDPDATDEPEEPVVPAADAVLNIVLVDYTGKRLSTAQLVTSGPANSTVVFTAEEIMAAAKMPKGCDFAGEVSDAAVICGTSGTVTIQVGKVATLKVTYVNVFGKTVGTATFTKVQTAPGFFSVTAEQIKDAAPEGRTVLWLTGAMAAYGRETNLIVPVL